MIHIAYIEDDLLLSRMYIKKLEESGFKVDSYNDGKTALSGITKKIPLLIVSDIMLPGMSGLELLKHLKSNAKTKKIPFVFLSNLSRSDEDIQRGLELGAIGYLLKAEMTPEEIVARLKEYISAKAPTDEMPERADERLKRAKEAS